MTLPSEELRTLKQVHTFLRDLINPKETPRVSRAVRIMAGDLLKHYPFDIHLDIMYAGKVCIDCGKDRQFCKCRLPDNVNEWVESTTD